MSKKKGKEVVVVEPEVKVPFVQIGDKVLDPIMTISKHEARILGIVHNGIQLTKLDTALGLWRYLLDGDFYVYSYSAPNHKGSNTFYIIADGESSFVNDDIKQRPLDDRPFNTLLLINSTSDNDEVAGDVTLVNLNSSYNVYHSSAVIGPGNQYSENTRTTVLETYFDKATVEGGSIPSGSYVNSIVSYITTPNNLPKGPNKFTFIDSKVSFTGFGETEVFINNSRISHCHFEPGGKVHLNEVTLSDKHFRKEYPGVHLSSPFDFTEIDILSASPARMVRVNNDDVVVILQNRLQKITLVEMSFRNPHSRRVIRNLAKSKFFGNKEPSEMEESVIDYLADNILSRCSMINLVSTAKSIVNGSLLRIPAPDSGTRWSQGIPSSDPNEPNVRFSFPPEKRDDATSAERWSNFKAEHPLTFDPDEPEKETGNVIYISGEDFTKE